MRFTYLAVFVTLVVNAASVHADGKVVAPRGYKNSLEEQSQEAIILFEAGDENREALEHLILKIGVRGQTDHFAWVIPFPKEPKVEKEDESLFKELFNYVESRRMDRTPRGESKDKDKAKGASKDAVTKVEVLSQQTVGSYEIATVRENEAGALNEWLKEEGYQPLPDGSEDVLDFYRKKRYVFACIKVADTKLSTKSHVELHPLRFTFHTGGRDGIYFPMKMTGLQADPFSVNLYVFFRFWLNDDVSKFGYLHRGFSLRYRDWDSKQCEANGGKNWSDPDNDPFLRDKAFLFPTVTDLFKKLQPDGRFYLTNIHARDLKPADVRDWTEDLWLFPYYRDSGHIPYDVEVGSLAEGSWPEVPFDWNRWFFTWGWLFPTGILFALVLLFVRRRWLATNRGTPPITNHG